MKKKTGIRFSFSCNAFRKYSLAKAIDAIAGAGYGGLELMADTPHAYPPHFSKEDREWLMDTINEYGIEIVNINAFMLCELGDFHHPSWIEQSPELRKQRIDYTEQCVRLAADLNVPFISTEPGGPIPLGMDKKEAWSLFLKGLEVLYPVAHETGVKILVEPEPGLLIENLQQTLYLMQRVDHEVVGVNFDAGHFFCVGEDPSIVYRELREFVEHVHLEDIPHNRIHKHTMLGEGAMDIKGFLEKLVEHEYGGFVTVELYPYEVEAPEIARKAKQYLDTIWS